MKWDEFCDLLTGIGPETPLGRIVAIRSEEDKDVLERFTKEEHRIRNEWRSKQVLKVSQEETDAFLEQMKQVFIEMAGGVKN